MSGRGLSHNFLDFKKILLKYVREMDKTHPSVYTDPVLSFGKAQANKSQS